MPLSKNGENESQPLEPECIAGQPAPSQESPRSLIPVRPPTPSHHPLWNVKPSPEYIERLFKTAFPEHATPSIRELEPGRSYNNRIYFLEPRYVGVQQYVLKVNGQFFGGEKVQNEVSCLRILEKYCPEIPIPRVMAWSENGTNVMVSSPHGIVKREVAPDDYISVAKAGWILMSRIPGKPVSNLPDLLSNDASSAISIARQLAEIVATWRSKIPATPSCGNLRFASGPSAADISLGPTTNDQSRPNSLTIRGVLGDDIPPSNSIPTTRDLHCTRLNTRLQELQSNDVYAANRQLIPLLIDFVENHLSCLFSVAPGPSAKAEFIFTHYDLAPRNVHVQILADGSPLIVGLVDFEFSGFFPRTEEFVNDEIQNKEDWSEEVYRAYLEKLEELGVATPLRGVGEKEWQRERWLARLANNIAPWWLPGEKSGLELAAALEESAGAVRDAVGELRALSGR